MKEIRATVIVMTIKGDPGEVIAKLNAVWPEWREHITEPVILDSVQHLFEDSIGGARVDIVGMTKDHQRHAIGKKFAENVEIRIVEATEPTPASNPRWRWDVV